MAGYPRSAPVLVPFKGGVDVVSPSMGAAPGTLRFSLNYESAIGGGYERIGGIERFDGRPRPSDAAYVVLTLAEPVVNIAIGDTLLGVTSAAEGLVFRVDGDKIALTRVAGSFAQEAVVEKITSAAVGTVTDEDTAVLDFDDNALQEAAANVYRLDILAVPGSGPVRGLAVLHDAVYAWRNAADGLSMVIHKATPAGWTAVPLFQRIAFAGGSSAYADGGTLTQGGATASIKRVVLTSGLWSASSASGYFVIGAVTGGVFAPGAAAGGGACSLTSAVSAITLAPGGQVSTVVHNFGGQAQTTRLYGCDGVNPEFEFDGEVLAPIDTGMTSVRATRVNAHKQRLFFAYLGSVQHSAAGEPYVWSTVLGAGELAVGDDITDLISVGGSAVDAAMMVMTRNSVHVLYGSGPSTWNLAPLSLTVGGAKGSAKDIGGVVALDWPGFAKYPATQAFGNFLSRSLSTQVTPIVAGHDCACSVFVQTTNRYRVFFTDGTAVCGFPSGDAFEWMPIDYGTQILHALNADIAGASRTFYADIDGFVYEADRGRNFDGREIESGFITQPLAMGGPMVRKQFRYTEFEIENPSACALKIGAEFIDGEEEPQEAQELDARNHGIGLLYSMTNWSEAYWGAGVRLHKRLPTEGQGVAVSLVVHGKSSSELPHKLRYALVVHTPRRLAR